MRAADTNVLLRIVTRDDSEQTAVADRFVRAGAWVSVLALAETVWVLDFMFERTPREIASAVEFLLEHKSLILEDSDAVAAALELFRSRPSLGFAACLILELARKAGHLPLGTFDRALGKGEGAHTL